MTEEEYQAGLAQLRSDWGGVHIDRGDMPGAVRADNDPLTGFIVGLRAPLFVEIINRALKSSARTLED